MVKISAAQVAFKDRVASLGPVKRMKAVRLMIKMYNELCVNCKRNARAGQSIDYEGLCNKCQESMKGYEERLNRMVNQ